MSLSFVRRMGGPVSPDRGYFGYTPLHTSGSCQLSLKNYKIFFSLNRSIFFVENNDNFCKISRDVQNDTIIFSLGSFKKFHRFFKWKNSVTLVLAIYSKIVIQFLKFPSIIKFQFFSFSLQNFKNILGIVFTI